MTERWAWIPDLVRDDREVGVDPGPIVDPGLMFVTPGLTRGPSSGGLCRWLWSTWIPDQVRDDSQGESGMTVKSESGMTSKDVIKHTHSGAIAIATV
jgi:hypothetical protein